MALTLFPQQPGAVRQETLARVEGDDRWRLVRITPALLEVIGEAMASGPVSIAWGVPDDEGVYTPTITVRYHGW